MPEYGSGGGYTVVMAGPFASSGGGTGKLTTISAPVANWKGGTSPYSQVIAMDDISVNSKIDIQLSADQIELFRGQDIAFTVENRSGEVTLVAVGDKPAANCVFQAIASEVLIVGDSDRTVIIGNTVKTTSFTQTGGTMKRPINMNGQKLYGLNDPNNDDEPVNLGTLKSTFRNGTVTGNLNDARNVGLYWVRTIDCTNTPFGDYFPDAYGFLEVIAAYPMNSVMQRFTDYFGGKTYVRNDVNDWTNWIRIDSVDNYPVGSIYLSLNGTSPASIYGGTWTQINERFLLGSGGTYASGSTGGEATHTLTISEMPYHEHGYESACDESGTDWIGQSGTSTLRKAVTDGTGGNQAHNNMPPYLVVYMWQRLA